MMHRAVRPVKIGIVDQQQRDEDAHINGQAIAQLHAAQIALAHPPDRQHAENGVDHDGADGGHNLPPYVRTGRVALLDLAGGPACAAQAPDRERDDARAHKIPYQIKGKHADRAVLRDL